MKAWLSLTQERRETFQTFDVDGIPNDPFVRLIGKAKRRSEFIWWVCDKLMEAGPTSVSDLIREHDRISPMSFAMETIGWSGELAECLAALKQLDVEQRFNSFSRKDEPVVKLLASVS